MNQTILQGAEKLFPLLEGKNYLLVCGHSFSRFPFADRFAPRAIFKDFTPNPLYQQAAEGVRLFNSTGCDAIVAVGGGSAMDIAKCIKLFCRMNPQVNYLEQEYRDTGIPLFAMPTTAGTGSESTRHAVVYYNGKKQSISHPSIVPDYAVLEPSVLKDLPLYQKKCTMLDGICQAIESWWSVSSTEESIDYSRKALLLFRDYWQAYIEKNDPAAAEKIMLAANLAGRAINLTATTAAHAMSYKLTGLYGVPHGHAVALCMSGVWQAMNTEPCTDARGKSHLQDTLAQIETISGYAWFQNLMKELEMEKPVSQQREQDLSVLIESVNPVRLKNNPVSLNEQMLRKIYEDIVK